MRRLVGSLLLFGALACDRSPAVNGEVRRLSARGSGVAVAAEEEAPRGGDGLRNGRGTGRGRGRKSGDCPVLVDGALSAVLRYRELPPGMPTGYHRLDDGRSVERFAVGPYLTALGVDLARVKAVHLHAGDGRVSVLDGEEIRRVGDRLQIHFTAETSGRPTFKYPGVALRTNTTVDGIHALAVYVGSEPPRYQHGKLFLGGATVDAGVPEARLAARGTRVYRDGKLVRTFRRRDVEGDGKSLVAALASVGVSVDGISRVELVGSDEGLRAVDTSSLASVTVSSPRGAHGRLAVDGDDPTELDAVLLYARAVPSPRHALARPASSPQGGSSPLTPASLAGPPDLRFAQLAPTDNP